MQAANTGEATHTRRALIMGASFSSDGKGQLWHTVYRVFLGQILAGITPPSFLALPSGANGSDTNERAES